MLKCPRCRYSPVSVSDRELCLTGGKPNLEPCQIGSAPSAFSYFAPLGYETMMRCSHDPIGQTLIIARHGSLVERTVLTEDLVRL